MTLLPESVAEGAAFFCRMHVGLSYPDRKTFARTTAATGYPAGLSSQFQLWPGDAATGRNTGADNEARRYRYVQGQGMRSWQTGNRPVETAHKGEMSCRNLQSLY